MKRPASFKLEEETLSGLAELARLTSRSQAGVIEDLVRERLATERAQNTKSQIADLRARIERLEGCGDG